MTAITDAKVEEFYKKLDAVMEPALAELLESYRNEVVSGLAKSRDQIENNFFEVRDKLAVERNRCVDLEKKLAEKPMINWLAATAHDDVVVKLVKERDHWKAEAERWRDVAGPSQESVAKVVELEVRLEDSVKLSKWEEACRAKDADIDKLLAERANWQETAAQFSRDVEYYRGLVVKVGEMLGVEAKTCDDGGVVNEVLVDKVPEVAATKLKSLEDECTRLHKLWSDANHAVAVQEETIKELEASRNHWKQCAKRTEVRLTNILDTLSTLR